MSGALRELLATFGVEVKDKELHEFDKSLGGVLETVTKVGQAVAGAFAVREISEFFSSAIEAGARLDDLSTKLGIGTDELQKFQFAARLVGIDGEQAAHSLQFLNKSIGEAVTGGGDAAATFAKLKVHLKDSSGHVRELGDVIPEVAEAFKGMGSQQERTAVAMKLFGREGAAMVPILMGGKEGLEELNKEFAELGGGMSEDFVKSAKKTDDEILKVKFGLTNIKTAIAGAALPFILKLVGGFKHFVGAAVNVAKNTMFIHDAMAMLKAVGIVAFLAKLVPVLQRVAVNGLAAEAPWLLWAAAIALVTLAVQDLMVFMRGGKSVIGDALGLEDSIALSESLRDTWANLKDAWAELKPFADDLLMGLLHAIPVAIKGALTLLLAFKSVFDLVVSMVDMIFSIPQGIDAMGSAVRDGLKNIKGDFGAIGSLWANKDNAGPAGPAPAAGSGVLAPWRGGTGGFNMIPDQTVANGAWSPTAAREAKDIERVTKIDQKNNIVVNVIPAEGDDPNGTGKQIGAGISTELQRQKYNLRNAVGKL